MAARKFWIITEEFTQEFTNEDAFLKEAKRLIKEESYKLEYEEGTTVYLEK